MVPNGCFQYVFKTLVPNGRSQFSFVMWQHFWSRLHQEETGGIKIIGDAPNDKMLLGIYYSMAILAVLRNLARNASPFISQPIITDKAN